MKKYSIQDVANIVESEGLGYAIHGYLELDMIENEELKVLCNQASELMGKIEKILEPYTN